MNFLCITTCLVRFCMFNKLKILTSSNLLSFLHMKDIKFEEQVLLVNMFMLNCNFFVKFDLIF